MVYLLIGQDSPAKDIELKRIRKEFLLKELEQFNLDILYAEGLSLKGLQERLLVLPVKSPKRVLVIKNSEKLDKEIKDFITEWPKKPYHNIILILDINHENRKDAFIRALNKHAKIIRFRENISLNTFDLSRSIEERRPDYALRVLNQLIKDGEWPEMILGGLRYSLENSLMSAPQVRLRLKLLLNCDIEIKTSKLKPAVALEKLVVNLCVLT
ncbi:MAG: hypothetical protein COT38_05475 [Candidatus Omnitrophica bacterium CG08_land_8_20_14_0_20_41_16]|uniref:DNA polymerase III delta N-terminal domain-containing protein n=1 Tax=Candidatus Sherwoodlollariibacterium unditelluris TaxID=1974757 RepID=A0A2G9YLP0_9BACT|nr:MAG: hypothetical protein COX41_01855 [Candidatus Omnitrophica bacterium CG23_combo_of_CG06-09_8_20_14_all_41_10]PIS33418.1 MAG: hypothetical protein COT38_05475 [Candidatus Omnitrophica bacterium CG08_land_8_20_14_0_20_41_16]